MRVSMPRIVFFGPQGSTSVFSESATSVALNDANSSEAGTLLLQRCHVAFQAELKTLGDERDLIFGSNIDLFPAPVDLLSPDPRFTTNPIIESTTICLLQLLRYISGSEIAKARDEGILSNIHECAGYSSGILPAVVVATSPTIDTFIINAVEAYRLAFWIGYRAGYHNPLLTRVAAGGGSSALVVSGTTKQRIVDIVNELRGSGRYTSLNVAAIGATDSVTVAGTNSDLRLVEDICQQKTGLVTKYAHLHAIYHGGEQLQTLVDGVCDDARNRDIKYPDFRHLKVPLRSPNDGSYIKGGCRHASKSLLECVLRLLFVYPVDWPIVSNKISESFRIYLRQNELASLRIAAVGPSSGLMLHTLRRQNSSPRVTFEDLWLATEPAKQDDAASDPNAIAIIGMAVQFPHSAGAEELWKTISEGLNTFEEIPESRFDISEFHNAETTHTKGRKMATKWGNFIQDMWSFDHGFFNISARESKSMDPQQKLVLTTTKKAMENAGYVEDSTVTFDRKAVGCYFGVATGDYADNLRDDIDVYYSPGTLRAFISGKVSYHYKLSGPSMVIDTACSASMVALYQACRALQNEDCRTAIAGGVNVIAGPDMYLGLARAHFLSPTGQCKSFDGAADGYCRAEGCGVFILKKLSDAMAESDRIHGIIRGVEMNHSGCSKSITHPDGSTQAALLERLLRKSGVGPASIDVIEAHGTGTQAGDNTEISSIHGVFAKKARARPLYVTSIKGNIGHAEAASGAASLAKVLLMLQKERIPGQASLTTINPRLQPFVTGSLEIPTQSIAWKQSRTRRRRAVVNNFGASGSNVAVLVEEFQEPSSRRKLPHRSAYPFAVSARTPKALQELIASHREYLVSNHSVLDVEDVCYTVSARRQRYEWQLAFSCNSSKDLLSKLETAQQKEFIKVTKERKPIVFVFSGQGSVYPGMGAELLRTAPVFQSRILECDAIIQRLGFPSIVGYVAGENNSHSDRSDEERVVIEQSALVALEYSLAKQWMTFGITPDFVVGHSLGELAALAISGAISLEDILRLVTFRAQKMVMNCQKGTSMLACRFSETKAEQMFAKNEEYTTLTVACQNSLTDCVVGGSTELLRMFEQQCAADGLKTKFLGVPYGFHTAAMDQITSDIIEIGKSIQFSEPSIPIMSTVSANFLSAKNFEEDYFALHMRRKVRFHDAIRRLEELGHLSNGIVIDIGPHPISLPLVRASISQTGTLQLPSLRKDSESWTTIISSLCQLSLHRNVKWRTVFSGCNTRLVDLPGHPLYGTANFVKHQENRHKSLVTEGPAVINGAPTQNENDTGAPSNTRYGFSLSRTLINGSVFDTSLACLGKHISGHNVGGVPICPASVFHEMVLEAAHSSYLLPEGTLCAVRDIEFSRPLIYSEGLANEIVRVTLQGNPTKWRMEFKVESLSNKLASPLVHCTGILSCDLVSRWSTAWAEAEALVSAEELQFSRKNAQHFNHIHRKMLYETIFPRVVAYGKDYHTISSLKIATDGSKGYGYFQIPGQEMPVDFIVQPAFTDTLLHAAGFIANSHVNSNEVCICTNVKSIEVAYHRLDYRSSFSVYCRLTKAGPRLVSADAFAVDSDGSMVAVVKEMHFKILPLSKFQSSLKDALNKYLATTLRPSETPKPSPQRAQHNSIQKSSVVTTEPQLNDDSINAKVNKVIAEACSIIEDIIESSASFASLGIDSLMIFEIFDALQKAFPASTIGLEDIVQCASVQDLYAVVQPKVVSLSAAALSGTMQRDDVPYQLAHNHDRPYHYAKPQVNDILPKPVQHEVELKVTKILAELCDIDISQVRQETSLGSLGVDSMLFIELGSALQETFEIDISTDDLTRCETLSDIVCLVHPLSPLPASLTSHISLLRTSTSGKAPCYLFHDGSGFSTMYQKIEDLDRTVYGFSSPSLVGSSTNFKALSEMASCYIREIEATEPVILGGWSFGGVVALEAGRQLRRAGKTVKGIILIDSPCPRDHTPLPRLIIEHVLQSSCAKTSGSAIKEKLLDEFERNALLLGSYTPAPGPVDMKVVALHCRDVFDSKRLCDVSYPWLSDPTARTKSLADWRELLDQDIEILDIPGHHFEVFHPKNLVEVSAKLREACAIIESTN